MVLWRVSFIMLMLLTDSLHCHITFRWLWKESCEQSVFLILIKVILSSLLSEELNTSCRLTEYFPLRLLRSPDRWRARAGNTLLAIGGQVRRGGVCDCDVPSSFCLENRLFRRKTMKTTDSRERQSATPRCDLDEPEKQRPQRNRKNWHRIRKQPNCGSDETS